MSLQGTFEHDELVSGDFSLVTDGVTVESGSTLVKGTVLGKITIGTVPATGTADAGNTGDGTLTVVTGAANTKVGIYTVECIEAVTNGGVFKVVDPDGATILSNVIIAAGAGGIIAFTSDQINGTLTDGATDFALGDLFTVTIPAGSGEVVAVDATSADGSNKPYAVLAEDVDASAAADRGAAYKTGQFNSNKLIVGSGVIADYEDQMRDLSMFIRAAVAD